MGNIARRDYPRRKLIQEMAKGIWPRFVYREIATGIYRLDMEPEIFFDHRVPGEDNRIVSLKELLPEGDIQTILSVMVDVLSGREIFFENRRNIDSVGPFTFEDTLADIAAEEARVLALP